MMLVRVEEATLQENCIFGCSLTLQSQRCQGNMIYEGTDCQKAALSSGMTGLEGIVVPARSVGWRRNEEVTLLYLVP